MDAEHYRHYFSTDEGNIEMIVADNMCNTFVYPEFLLKRYSSYNFIDDHKVNTVLDVGCGAGPFCVYFGLRGKRVDGIDINPIAVECCLLNINKYNLSKNVSIMLTGIQDYKTDVKYDLIICNPPLGDCSYMRNAPFDYNRINYKLEHDVIDAETEDYLTNCWKDVSGKDMVDYIFERAGHILQKDGKILIVCGDDSMDGASYICENISLFPKLRVLHRQKYTERLHLEDVDEVFECDKNYNVLVFGWTDC